jgi:hypothetical protein
MIKTNLLYPAGCYGEFTFRMLNLKETTSSLSYNAHIEPVYTEKYNANHHLEKEQNINGHVTKITYTDADIDLINRNKWTKVKGHLEEQAIRTFPDNSNRELYTIAIYKCDLLNQNNHFKKLENPSNLEIKFNWFLSNCENWLFNFGNIFKSLFIPITDNKLEDYYNIFSTSQQSIIKQHQENNDLIAEANIFGEKYFKKYGCDYNELYFNEMHTTLGGHNGK